MKKITKILALTLALITLALSCTSCGNLFVSKEEMAENVRRDMKIEYIYFYTTSDGSRRNETINTFGGPELFNPNGLKFRGKNPNCPENLNKDYSVEVNEKKKEIIIRLYVNGVGDGYNGNNQFEITVPYKIKKANCGDISKDKKTLSVAFYCENIKTTETKTGTHFITGEEYTTTYTRYYITKEIIINY